MRLSKVFAAVAALAAVSTSYAGTITHVSSGPAGNITAITSDGLRSGKEYIVTTDMPAGTFASFCLEPYNHYFAPTPDAYTVGAFTPAQANELSKLFTGGNWKSWDYTNDGVSSPAAQHGMALAVWDIMEDGVYNNLSAANFNVFDDGLGGAAIAFANAAYAAGNVSMAGSLRLLDLTDPSLQNMVIAVPEPSTYAMLLAGLAGIGFMARRRQQRG